MLIELIDGWLHPLGETEREPWWHIESETLGCATGRYLCGEERRERCTRIVFRMLGVDALIIEMAKEDDRMYLFLLSQLVEIRKNKFPDKECD